MQFCVSGKRLMGRCFHAMTSSWWKLTWRCVQHIEDDDSNNGAYCLWWQPAESGYIFWWRWYRNPLDDPLSSHGVDDLAGLVSPFCYCSKEVRKSNHTITGRPNTKKCRNVKALKGHNDSKTVSPWFIYIIQCQITSWVTKHVQYLQPETIIPKATIDHLKHL